MTPDELKAVFERHADQYIKFERIQKPLHPRPDIAAFLRLHELCPRDRDMVCASEHDEFFLDVSPEELAAAATEDDLIYLIRCGVRLDLSTDSLAMFS